MEILTIDLHFILFCFILIILSLILLYIVNVKELKKIYKPVLLFVICVFVIAFFLIKNESINFQVDKNILKFYNLYAKQNITIQSDYIIVVGDSRMKYLSQDDSLSVPVNMKFIAKPGAEMDWFKDEAINELENALNNKDENRFYSVVFNMGVNDLGNYASRELIAKKYYDLYQNLALKYTDVMFYVMSINPINDYSYRNKSFPKVTNNKIIGTNRELVSMIDENDVQNISYCDAFNSLEFGIYDGIHYDSKTNKKILNYIINDCVLKGYL